MAHLLPRPLHHAVLGVLRVCGDDDEAAAVVGHAELPNLGAVVVAWKQQL